MTTHRIIIRTSDISILEGVSSSRASEIHNTIKAGLNKGKKQRVTIAEYCDDRGFSYEKVLTDLGLKNGKVQ